MQWSSFPDHCTLYFERAYFLNPKLIFLTLATPIFASTIYTDGTFTESNWQTVVLAQTGTMTQSVARAPTDGNPGDYVRATFSAPASAGGQSIGVANVGRYHNDFSWNPSADGPLGALKFSMDVKNFTKTGLSNDITLLWRPFLIQDGLAFSVNSSSLSVATGTGFTTLNWDFTTASEWVGFININQRPDFSASGSTMVFGYRVQIPNLGCPAQASSCTAGSIVDGMDNYRAELTAAEQTSGIPEPSTWALGLAGLAALAIKRSQLSKYF